MILVLPGTKWLEELCRKIKKRNEEILLVSPEDHPYCEKYADIFFQSDIFHVDKILRFCEGKRIDGVLSDECDIVMPIIAELGSKLKVSTIDQEMAALYTDKYLMREFSSKHGIGYPEYKLCHTIDDALTFFRELKHKMIIKPLDSNASHGVFTINDEQELADHFEQSLSFSHVKKAVIAERYINGPEFTVDGIKAPNGHFSLAVSEKKHFGYNENIAYELFFTHNNRVYDYDGLRTVNDSFVNQSGLEYGLTHAEYKYEDGEFYLIEIAARGGGNQISALITQFMSGYDSYDFLIDCALGNVRKADFVVPRSYKDRAAVLHFFHVPNGGGIVKNIIGVDLLKNNPAILDYAFNFHVGDEIHNAVNDSVRIGYYIAAKDSERELRMLQENISEKVHIEVTGNKKT